MRLADVRILENRVTPAVREHYPSSGLVALSQDALNVPFVTGEIIAGKYEVTGLLGSGGMGYVISARHTELGEMVALKFLRPEALAHPELVERFAREARAAAKIRSEHVARVYDVGSLPDGVPFIVMEHLAGRDLADVLHQEGALPISVAVDYIMQACEALAAAHACGIVHRDIKPENLFLIRQAEGMDIIKILDFGISKVAIAKGKRDLVRTQMALGSPVYMSPEQIRRSDQVDARSDIWAVGCVLFELLTGVTAFDEPSLLELSAAILEREPVPLITLRPDAPEELEEVVLRCLNKDPAKRFQNVAELAVALYPFAPRRARISAERCYHMLRSAGMVSSDFHLASVAPPSMTSGQHAMTLASIGPRTTTPAAVDILIDESEALSPPRKGAKVVIWATLGVAAAVASFMVVRARELPAGNDSRAAGAQLAPAPAASAAVIALAQPITNVVDLDLEPSPVAAAPSVQAATSTSGRPKPVPAANLKQIARPARAASPSKRPRAQEGDDLDPGF
jgi:serine/threonine protein kinase